jgi:cytoskeletal protein CcmA (bactofilin family)
MSNRFLSKGNKNVSDDDDLVLRQLSALGDSDDDFGTNETNQPIAKAEAKEPVKQEETAKPVSEPEKKSIIQQGTVITGSIAAATALFIYGTVNGNVACESDITVDGTVEGNVKACNIQVLSGQVKGDIESKSAVNVQKGAVVNGDITGELLSCDGKVEGNTNVKGKAIIKENAVIIGDIICEKISICEGAVCKGSIQTDIAKMSSSYNDDSAVKANTPNQDNRAIVTDLKKYI